MLAKMKCEQSETVSTESGVGSVPAFRHIAFHVSKRPHHTGYEAREDEAEKFPG